MEEFPETGEELEDIVNKIVPIKGKNMRINPIKIFGVWKEGYALDKHVERSIFIESDIYGNPQYDTERTEVGECLYRLKYRYNYSNTEKK